MAAIDDLLALLKARGHACQEAGCGPWVFGSDGRTYAARTAHALERDGLAKLEWGMHGRRMCWAWVQTTYARTVADARPTGNPKPSGAQRMKPKKTPAASVRLLVTVPRIEGLSAAQHRTAVHDALKRTGDFYGRALRVQAASTATALAASTKEHRHVR